MCVGNYTHIFLSENELTTMTPNNDSLSVANQQIHEQRNKIIELESRVAMLETCVAEEQEQKYTAWKKLASVKELSNL
jgi:uncharacterized protein YigA (DUF484 family)